MNKITIVGDREVALSLLRAFRYIDCFSDVLKTKFIQSSDIDNSFELCNISDIQRKDILSETSLLILANREEQGNISLIGDIRFSTKENFDNPGVPIILLTILSLNNYKFTTENTAYLHLGDHGTLLSIPFTLESLYGCLKRSIYFDDELLHHIKNSFKRSALIHEYSHGMNKNNYKRKLEDIRAVVPDNYKDHVNNLQVKEYDLVISEIEKIKKEIEETEEEIYNET